VKTATPYVSLCDHPTVVAVRSVALVGLFSAKVRDHHEQLDALEARLATMGVRVRQRFVQRRGVSDGGVRLMDSPLSRRFLIRAGKVDEVARACASGDLDAVVFVNDLTDHQRRWLSTRIGLPVLTRDDLDAVTSELTVPPQRPRHTGTGSRPRHR
jgi:50S ribosomal subunit-associated GTPase HflX